MSSKPEVTFSQVVRFPTIHTIRESIKEDMEVTKFVPSIIRPDESDVGIEIEIENIHSRVGVGQYSYDLAEYKDLTRHLWDNTEDGSLRNNGREFVSFPVRKSEIEFAISKLFNYLGDTKETRNFVFSERTGIHVHVNARDMTLDNLKTFLIAYIIAEPVLYNFCGGKRHKNIFCVPLNQTDSQFCGWVFKGKTLSDLVGGFSGWKKYNGLNLRPITQHGTIEFRHMVGTADQNKLNRWIDLVLHLKKFSVSNRFEDVVYFFSSLNSSSEYSIALQKIFGDNVADLFFSNINQRMEEAVMFLKGALSTSTLEVLTGHFREVGEKFEESSFFLVGEKRGILQKPQPKKKGKTLKKEDIAAVLENALNNQERIELGLPPIPPPQEVNARPAVRARRRGVVAEGRQPANPAPIGVIHDGAEEEHQVQVYDDF